MRRRVRVPMVSANQNSLRDLLNVGVANAVFSELTTELSQFPIT